jgi:regulatory factor X 1/2/3
MLADLNRVDFANVQEQASWVCGCDMDTVNKLEESFKATLQQQVYLLAFSVCAFCLCVRITKPQKYLFISFLCGRTGLVVARHFSVY